MRTTWLVHQRTRLQDVACMLNFNMNLPAYTYSMYLMGYTQSVGSGCYAACGQCLGAHEIRSDRDHIVLATRGQYHSLFGIRYAKLRLSSCLALSI